MPPKPEDVPALMDDLITWLNSAEAWSLHPVEYAAIAHYRLVYIHPFVDGNGRTSRLLMNLRLIQAGYPPVIIKVEDRYKYYEALEIANSGDIRPFIRFIAQFRNVHEVLDNFWVVRDVNVCAIQITKEGCNLTKIVRCYITSLDVRHCIVGETVKLPQSLNELLVEYVGDSTDIALQCSKK